MIKNKVMGVIATVLLLCVSACGNSSAPKADEPSVKEEESVQYTLELAQKYLADGNYEEAIEVFTALIEVEPNNVDLYLGRAEAYTYVKKYQEASNDYTQVVSLDNTNEQAKIRKSVLEFVNGDRENGEKDLNEIIDAKKEASAEEKEQFYQDIISYLERLEIPVTSEENNDHYSAQVFEMPDGSHLILIKTADNDILTQIIEPGEEIPDLSVDNAFYFFDWTANYGWYDYNSGDWYDGDIIADFHEEGTVDIYAGDAKYTYPLIEGASYYAGYLLMGDSPTAENVETDHYVLYGDFDGNDGEHFWGVIIGETHAGNSNLFTPAFHE